jgi:hypothetical protein
MPKMIVLVALITTATASVTNADAQTRKNYAWCLETSVGGGSGGGGTRLECRYNSRSQCLQSKVGHADTCMRNPRR